MDIVWNYYCQMHNNYTTNTLYKNAGAGLEMYS